MKSFLKFLLSFSAFLTILFVGCSAGSDSPATITKGNWQVSGNVNLPNDRSATATASLRSAYGYDLMTAHLVNISGNPLKEPVALAVADGYFEFTGIPDNTNLQVKILSNSGKKLANVHIDALLSDQTGLVINSRSTVIASLVSASNFSITAARINQAWQSEKIDLLPMSNLIENWWRGSHTTFETEADKVLLSYFGNAQIQSIIQAAADESENDIIIDQPADDLIFYADPGWRTGFGTGNPMAGISESGQIYLYHHRDHTQPEPGNKLAISYDGLTFSDFYAKPYTHLYHPKFVLMPDGVTRRTYFPDLRFDGEVVSESFISDGQPVRDSGVRFTATSNDNGTIGIVEVFPDNRGGLVMLYIGDRTGANDIRRAYSPPGDNGLNFTFTNSNVLGDANLPRSSDKNVDQFSLLLPDGRRRLFAMSHGGSRINSFITTDHGTTFTPETGIRLTPEVFTEFKVHSLHDPSVVILPDGRHRMYVCARVDYNKSAPDNASDRYNYVIVSATTRRSL